MVPHWSDGPEGKGAIHLTPDGWVGVFIMNGRASAALGFEPGDPLTLAPMPAAAK